ncbi:hypothetical protein VIBNISOn1_1480017 [Vibrio nigripulchritudo SOn1]|uniref:N-acetyltransferase domain-containing protein n=1 Tax=Vibrio nigripulchritudo SOn1 TaxID=1238450 RepID=A0AAV2VL74_9VIBR|nr:GNAT family N-acetyltransferase [Vibrio nigripulchritudo]CCO45443.1 hypothetical protein VIBNISOn1_1480017 [Vibrio nigripulchritudo SOn1]
MYNLLKVETLDSIVLQHIFQFSQWMKGSGVESDEVFTVVRGLLKQNTDKMNFYCVFDNNDVVGYLVLFLGLKEISYSRIHFFAIDPAQRQRGVGKGALAFILEQLLLPNDVTTVACKSSLTKFYLACGFKLVAKADNGDDVLMFSEGKIDVTPSLLEKPLATMVYDGSSKERYLELEALFK